MRETLVAVGLVAALIIFACIIFTLTAYRDED
jgi:hypothetical protein